MSQERQATVLALLRRLLPLTSPDAPGYNPAHFAQLSDGVTFFAALRIVAPTAFPCTASTAAASSSASSTTATPSPGDDAAVAAATSSLTGSMPETSGAQRQGNMRLLLHYIAAYARDVMSSPSTLPITHGLDPAVLAGPASDDGIAAVATAATPAGVAQQQQLTQLAGIVVAVVVLSGVPAVLSEVKALPRQEQVWLSDWVKDIMRTYAIKPRRQGGGGGADAASPTPSATQQRPPATPQFGGASVAASPMASRAAGGYPGSPAMGHRAGTSAGEEDEGYYRNATYQLRQELADVKAQLTALQDAYRLSKEDQETAESKYRLLLGDQARVSPAMAATAAGTSTAGPAADGTDGEGAGDMLAVWQRRCAQKDETVAALTARIEQQSTQVAALKEAAAAHEMALQALRRRLKSAEEGIVIKSEERREALQKLSVTEDKLAAQMKARVDLETQVEELQSRVMLLTLEQDRLRGVGTDEVGHMTSSFASNGSVDRVLALENELDEARQQRDSLQRQVGILQRQVATMIAPVVDAGTTNDMWRAQLRQVEREREELRQQLTTALERVGTLQQQLTASDASANAAAVMSASGATGASFVAASTGSASPTTAQAGAATAPSGTSAAAAPNADASLASVAVNGSEVDASSVSAGADSPRHLRATANASGLGVTGKSRDAARREQVILSSLLLQYSYRNLLLQQHDTLLHKDAMEAEVARRRQAEEHLDIMRQNPSVLTKQRRDVEQGLLETVLLGAKLRMMRVEK